MIFPNDNQIILKFFMNNQVNYNAQTSHVKANVQREPDQIGSRFTYATEVAFRRARPAAKTAKRENSAAEANVSNQNRYAWIYIHLWGNEDEKNHYRDRHKDHYLPTEWLFL